MEVSFLFITFLALVYLFWKKQSPVETVLRSAVLWFLSAFVFTEVSSAFHLLTYDTAVCFWGASAIILLTLSCFKAKRKTVRIQPVTIRPIPHQRSIIALICAIIVILFITLYITRISPPNTTDAMEYHLSRIEHWIQNRSVAHYPTVSLRQLYINPGAEYILLQFRLMTGLNMYANLIQWFALVGVCIAIGGITAVFGLPLLYQIIAILICATIPMVIIQSTSTQTDLITSFWIVTAVYFLLLYRKKHDVATLVFFSLASAFAFFTKSTAYFFLFPFFSILLYEILRKRHLRHIPVVIICIGGIMTPYILRNWSLFHNPFGPESDIYLVGGVSVRICLSNMIKSLSLQCATAYAAISSMIYSVILFIHTNILHIDINDPRTTWPYWDQPFTVYTEKIYVNEGLAASPVHLFLCFMAGIYFLKHTVHTHRMSIRKTYAIAVMVGYLSFLFFIRWQPWQTRLQLPFFVLATPLLAYFLSRLHTLTQSLIIICLIGCSVNPLFFNENRALLGPTSIIGMETNQILFMDKKHDYAPYIQTSTYIRDHGYTNIGLFIEGSDGYWDYPFWPLIHNPMARIEYVHVTNVSARLPVPAFTPQVIVCVDCTDESKDIFREYVPAADFGSITLYIPQ